MPSSRKRVSLGGAKDGKETSDGEESFDMLEVSDEEVEDPRKLLRRLNRVDGADEDTEEDDDDDLDEDVDEGEDSDDTDEGDADEADEDDAEEPDEDEELDESSESDESEQADDQEDSEGTEEDEDDNFVFSQEEWLSIPKPQRKRFESFRKKHRETLDKLQDIELQQEVDKANFGSKAAYADSILKFQEDIGASAEDMSAGFEIFADLHKGGDTAINRCLAILDHLGYQPQAPQAPQTPAWLQEQLDAGLVDEEAAAVILQKLQPAQNAAPAQKPANKPVARQAPQEDTAAMEALVKAAEASQAQFGDRWNHYRTVISQEVNKRIAEMNAPQSTWPKIYERVVASQLRELKMEQKKRQRKVRKGSLAPGGSKQSAGNSAKPAGYKEYDDGVPVTTDDLKRKWSKKGRKLRK